jgi:hypothetical protein
MPPNDKSPARPPRPPRPSGQSRSSRPSRSTGAAPKTGLAGLRERNPLLVTLLPVALVVVIIVVMVIIKTSGGSGGGSGAKGQSNGTTALPASVLADVTSVSPSTFAAVGLPTGLAHPIATPKGTSTLTASDGKPEMLYVGAEFCPFCAAERWAMVVALSRFGTFSGLRATHSSSSDEFPNTQTFSFYKSTYTSQYLDFTTVEEFTNYVSGSYYAALQTPTAAQSAIVAKYDVAPYTTQAGTIPFINIGNHYIVVGSSYTPQILQGMSMTAIARQLNNPSTEVAAAIDGTANEITAAVCAATGDQPASVCSTPAIVAIAKKLAG